MKVIFKTWFMSQYSTEVFTTANWALQVQNTLTAWWAPDAPESSTFDNKGFCHFFDYYEFQGLFNGSETDFNRNFRSKDHLISEDFYFIICLLEGHFLMGKSLL